MARRGATVLLWGAIVFLTLVIKGEESLAAVPASPAASVSSANQTTISPRPFPTPTLPEALSLSKLPASSPAEPVVRVKIEQADREGPKSELASNLSGLAALAWPMVALIAIVLFRRDISKLSNRLVSGEFLGAKANFKNDLDRLDAEVSKASAETTPPLQTETPTSDDRSGTNPPTTDDALKVAEADAAAAGAAAAIDNIVSNDSRNERGGAHHAHNIYQLILGVAFAGKRRLGLAIKPTIGGPLGIAS